MWEILRQKYCQARAPYTCSNTQQYKDVISRPRPKYAHTIIREAVFSFCPRNWRMRCDVTQQYIISRDMCFMWGVSVLRLHKCADSEYAGSEWVSK
jgi:hypothetical protein